MGDRSTETLLHGLARDLRPVRRVPPLRLVAAGVLAAWLAGMILHWSLGGPLPALGETGGYREPIYLTILAGLVIAAAGGVMAALARAVPGRESVASGAVLALGGGLLLCTGAAAFGALDAGAGAPVPLNQSLWCTGRAALLAIAPGVAVLVFVTRGWERQLRADAWILALGSFALGAIAVHASCVAGDGPHRLVAHIAGPLLLATLLALPLGAWLRSGAR